jgi:hypothetical protein
MVDTVDTSRGSQPGVVEGLVGVEAPEPHDEALVEQQGLELLAAVIDQRLGERRPRHGRGDGVEAEVGQLGRLLQQQVGHDDERLGLALGIGHAQLAALGEGNHDLGVLGGLVLGVVRSSRPGADVDDQQLTAVG